MSAAKKKYQGLIRTSQGVPDNVRTGVFWSFVLFCVQQCVSVDEHTVTEEGVRLGGGLLTTYITFVHLICVACHSISGYAHLCVCARVIMDSCSIAAVAAIFTAIDVCV